jgi:luciferase-type oxidoreductase
MTKFNRHRGYSAMFKEGHLTLGLFFAIESYQGAVPVMDITGQMEIAKMAESHGFAALYFRDVPLHVPSFGDVGHIHDPWVFMGHVGAHTSRIALATGSIITTLRHPLHVAKSAASVDQLSGQRLVLGLATGDRPTEFAAFNQSIEDRGELFREALAVMRSAWSDDFPSVLTRRVNLTGGDTLPKPALRDIPVLVTGNARQSVAWIADHSDGWLYYPQSAERQAETIHQWRSLHQDFKPFSQSLYIDLAEDPNAPPTPIALGFRSGHRFLVEYLNALRAIGVNHVGFNLKYGSRPAAEVVQELGEYVVPHFPAHAVGVHAHLSAR